MKNLGYFFQRLNEHAGKFYSGLKMQKKSGLNFFLHSEFYFKGVSTSLIKLHK